MKRISRSSFRMSSKDHDKGSGHELQQAPSCPPAMKGLQEFLTEAELSEYYSPLVTRLKVSTVDHLKYVQEDDLEEIGMTRPEMRRLKKFYKKEFHQGAMSKFRKAILKGGGDGAIRTLSPAPPTQREPRPMSSSAPYMRLPGKQIIPVDSIQFGRTLGQGEFGVVQQAVWKTELGETLQVAVKRLSREQVNSGSQNFLKEAAIMQEVDHEHIVRMFGVVLDAEDNMMLVTELAPMRSLLECIKDPALRADLPVTRLCDYAVQVCDGMSYLESKRLVHRDLAARNILVFNKNQVKISDLGLSRLLEVGQDYYQSRFSAGLKLPIAWCAPECINFLKFTPASDVWSFAVMLWEFFTYGFQPWAGLNGQQILQAIDEPNCQRLQQPELCTSDMYKLMRECWTHDPEARPMFSDILRRLPQLKPTQVKALKDYPSPPLEKGYIAYRAGDIIVVINKSPVTSSLPGLVWKGVLANGKSGLFDPTNAVPLIEPNISTVPAQTISIARKESTRKSGRKIRVDMIGHPQNDLRHTGHIGYDGAVFGDVSFIADNYDKLPVKVGPGNATSQEPLSLPRGRGSPDRNGHVTYSNSQQNRLDGHVTYSNSSQQNRLDGCRNGYGQSWISQESVNSQVNQDGRYSPSYLDIEDDSLFSDFKMPDLGNSFDFGPSFMDEVLKALDEKEKQVGSNSTPSTNKSHMFDPNSWTSSARPEPPVPAPREPRTSTSSTSAAPLLPAQPPRVEHPKEKKQAKVKPMSASEERMVDTAMARARELTSHMIGGSAQSPPVSPSQVSSFFGEDMGLISRLKNSMKRSASPKSEHKRTFSEEHKGDFDEVTPEAQQAYNMLVVKGSFKDKSGSSPKQHSVSLEYGHKDVSDSKRSGSRAQSRNTHESEASNWAQSNLTRESKSSFNSTKILTPVATVSSPGLPPPLASAPSQSLNKPAGMPLLRASHISAPVSAPRPAKTETRNKFEVPISWPQTDTQRMETATLHTSSASPDIRPKSEIKRQSNFTMPGVRDFEEPKKVIETLHVDDLESACNDALKRTSLSVDHSSAQSSQRSSTDNSESEHVEWGHVSPERSKLGQDVDARTVESSSNKDSVWKEQMLSMFEDDVSAPTPQEIMNKLRERRLNQHTDNKRMLGAENQTSIDVTTSRHQPTSRFGPQSAPDRAPLAGAGFEAGNEEVDTNPLRMLRGGAIPLRTAGRGSPGTGNIGNRGAVALRVPRLNFSRHLSSSDTDHQKTDLPTGDVTAANSTTDITVVASLISHSPAADVEAADRDIEPSDCAAADVPRGEKSTSPLAAEVASIQLASVAVVIEGIEPNTNQNNLSQELHTDQTNLLSTTSSPSQPNFQIDSHTPSHEAQLDADSSSERYQIPLTKREESPTPPRLPPRRSQSLNENSEKNGSHLSVLSDGLRRSNSVDEGNDVEAPALPPRKPQSGRTPLNIRPRERKFPLQIHLPSQEKDSRQQPTSPRPNSQQTSHLKSPVPTSPSTPTPLSPVHNRQHPLTSGTPSRQQMSLLNHHQPSAVHSPNSPTGSPHHNRHPALNSFTPHSLDFSHSFIPHSLDFSHSFTPHSLDFSHTNHHHLSNSVDLPPAYDLSFRHHPSSILDVADSEPTHMLLDLHPLSLPLPLSVSLPPSSDLSIIDEPTHVSLSSLIDNKHSWSATFTSASPLSPSFNHKHLISSRSTPNTLSPRLTRSFDRTLSNDTGIRGHTLYPDSSDNQSPPADLPPAPPTPSYREKLGLEQQKPKVVRSISHTPHTSKCGSHLLTVDSASSPSSFRGRSSSTNSPTSRSHHTDSSNTSSTQSSSHRVFHFPHRSYPIDDDDDAFFAEAPTDPHPYSQTPFHPLIPSSPKDTPNSSTVYTTISLLQASPDISPYKVSSSIPYPSHPQNRSSSPTVSWQNTHSSPLFQRNQENRSTPSTNHTSDKRINNPQRVPLITNSSHVYNTVLLPPSSHATSSPSNSRTTTKICATKPVNSISYKPRLQTSKQNQTSTKSNCHQQSPAFNVFKFPSTLRNDNSHITPSSPLTNHAAAQSCTRHRNPDLSPTIDDPSSSEVSPLMFASYTAASSVSYEDLRQFAFDRQKNCEEIETLLKIFSNQVTVDECMTALESTQWDVAKATKYLQLKKLLSLGVADVHKCKEALSASGWDLQCAAETLLESSRALATSSSPRGTSTRPGIIPTHNRPTTPEIVDV